MKKDTRKRFTLRIPIDLYDSISVRADETGTSINAFILQLLWEWIDKNKDRKELQNQE